MLERDDRNTRERTETTEQRFIAHGVVELEGRYLLLQRGTGRYLGDHWDVPGGTVEPGETPQEAAVRECIEEAGLRCDIGKEVSHFENMDTGGRDINFHTITFRLHPVSEVIEVTISHEHQDYLWVTKDEASDLPLVWHVEKTLSRLG